MPFTRLGKNTGGDASDSRENLSGSDNDEFSAKPISDSLKKLTVNDTEDNPPKQT